MGMVCPTAAVHGIKQQPTHPENIKFKKFEKTMMPMRVRTNRKPLSFKEENAVAVPLKIRNGIKNSNKFLRAMLIVRAKRTKGIGKMEYAVVQNRRTPAIQTMGSLNNFFAFTFMKCNKGNKTKHLFVFDKFIYGRFEAIKCLQYF